MEVEVAASPVEEIKQEIAEAVQEIEEHVDKAEEYEELHLSDEDVRKVVDAVYDKTKKLITDLLDAVEDAAEIAAESIEAPIAEAEAEAPVEEANAEEAPAEDVKPRRSHPLFRKPMKRED